MSAPPQNNNPSSGSRKKINPKAIFIILLIVAAVGYVIIIHDSSHHIDNQKTTNVTTSVTSKNIPSNSTIPSLPNSLEYEFSLTNSLSENMLLTKNNTIYIQFSGYFNEFPGSPPQYLPGNFTILYVQITVFNGTTSKTLVLPLVVEIKYNNQKYFIYQVEGNIPQLKELSSLLRPNEFIEFQFYINTGVIQGYTVW